MCFKCGRCLNLSLFKIFQFYKHHLVKISCSKRLPGLRQNYAAAMSLNFKKEFSCGVANDFFVKREFDGRHLLSFMGSRGHKQEKHFFMLFLLRRTYFLTTFYGLYFSFKCNISVSTVTHVTKFIYIDRVPCFH